MSDDTKVLLTVSERDADLIVTALRVAAERYEIQGFDVLVDRCWDLRGRVQWAMTENHRVLNSL